MSCSYCRTIRFWYKCLSTFIIPWPIGWSLPVVHQGEKARCTSLRSVNMGWVGQLFMNNRILCPAFIILLFKSFNHVINKLVGIHLCATQDKYFMFLNHCDVADFPTMTRSSFSELSEFVAMCTETLSLLIFSSWHFHPLKTWFVWH